MDRRTFLKAAAGAGLAIAIPITVDAAPMQLGRMDNVRFIETEVEIIVKVGPSYSDPLSQYTCVGWKAHGTDGQQYGQYLEFTDQMVTRTGGYTSLPDKISSWMEGEMREIPQLAHIKAPTADQIRTHLTEAANGHSDPTSI
jgi:hypothetical protein